MIIRDQEPHIYTLGIASYGGFTAVKTTTDLAEVEAWLLTETGDDTVPAYTYSYIYRSPEAKP